MIQDITGLFESMIKLQMPSEIIKKESKPYRQ
jgi:hypothetical protein